MKKLLDNMRHTDSYRDAKSTLLNGRNAVICGMPLALKSLCVATLYQDCSGGMLLLCSDEPEAQQLYENLRPICGDRVVWFPTLELLPFEIYAHNIELTAARVGTLSRLCQEEGLLVVACVHAITRKLTPPQAFFNCHLQLQPGMVYPPDTLDRALTDLGYERVTLTEIPGTFSRRGSLIDVFPLTAERPSRIEFFDDEIETIRFFDPGEQLSIEDNPILKVMPAHELPVDQAARQRAREALRIEMEQVRSALHGAPKKELENTFAPLLEYLEQGVWDNAMEGLMGLFYPDAVSLLEYMPNAMLVISEPENVQNMSKQLKDEREQRYFDLLEAGRLLPSFYHNFLDYDHLLKEFTEHPALLLCQLTLGSGGIETAYDGMFMGRELPAYAQNPQSFIDDMQDFLRKGYDVVFAASSDLRLQRMREILTENGLPQARMLLAGFTVGFASSDMRTVLVTERELFARETRRRRRRTYKGGGKIENFLDLRVGDYVVHATQGIGRYVGVERLRVGGTDRDYLHIEYAGNDKLYVPVDQLDLVQKYVGNDNAPPKLYKLGGGDWNRLKAKVRSSVRDMTQELLALYADRQQQPGFAFSPDTVWQREFEDSFPYEETPDQLASLDEIKKDMEQPRIMDRLLCGDVGFGKTEIALRAAFKALMDGKQVAILVPTTVLAQQHYHTVVDRFRGYPVKAGCLSRFFSTKQQKETLKKLAAGELDIIVGTHRLLSEDVQYKDLGLLIVDEEQRFGVAHKEKIKKLKKQVDVLTLSATPIPRTLHMALVGMREMSIISTPPQDRLPVQTYVVEYNDRLIRDAIARELARGGQVYFVHNRVQNIYDVTAELQQLLPQARFLIGHGQMKEKELEQVMMDFVNGEGDVLVSTTIIENGLDIPNANTIIVDDADTFGLSQLYQLRGRVGRSERQAFAYFTYRREHSMNDIAKKRLTAIRDFTELGAGFKIAMRDLELRGAGNILGPEQHGHIAAVGFDLYCKMLEEEMAKAKGEGPQLPELSTLMELRINAFVPDTYIADPTLKVEIYKRMAAAEQAEDITLLGKELRDRYGTLPQQVENLLFLGRIKLVCKQLCVASLLQKDDRVEVHFASYHPISGEALVSLLAYAPKRLQFSDKKGFLLRIATKNVATDHAIAEMVYDILCRLLSLTQEHPRPLEDRLAAVNSSD